MRQEKDPICGMTVDADKAKFVAQREGKTYWFCSAACQARFEAQSPR